jgi:outer membrane immunogenic protein
MQKLLLACVVVCGFAAPAVAADIPVAPYRPVLLRPLYSWTGCYLGVNIGGGAAPQTFTDTAGTFGVTGADLGNHTARGVVGGGQLGCDYQVGPFVLGLQGLFDLSGMKASNTQPINQFWNHSFVQTVATAAARIGYTLTPTMLIYVKAGGAWAHGLYNVSTPPGAIPPDYILALGSRTAGGWIAGVGLEWAFGGGNWSAFLEYDHMGFSSSRVSYTSTVIAGTTFPFEVAQSVNLVLVGINYRFNGGALGF